eukprot:134349-Pyramimonas_sp.AAC.2
MGCGFLVSSLGVSETYRSRLGAALGPCRASSDPSWGILVYIEEHWVSYCALRGALGPVLVHRGRSNPSRTPPVQVHGRGYGGRGKSLPEGE